ncbi:hypothetical protein EDD37DRAFT_696541 [Exophiala viscosa]|uniref:uncharacterized protein n=1 Tax=Exophiala viscosa TaxID=2486360 RepID=UPI00219A6E55|nr:hypothetical protein EDD37DRAFT_696541 [Exophiala viscosa]
MEGSPNHTYLSPPISAASPAPSTAGSFIGRNSNLPTPRTHPLRSGSQKEISLINYLDDKILRITRRYAKKYSNEMIDKDDARGYTTYDEFVSDVDPLLDVVWVSGTPTIQIPYLLSLAGLACAYLPAFPFSTTLFYVTGKIDLGFASLLQSSMESATTAIAVSHHVSVTEKVRIKSLVEETRIAAVNVALASGHASSVHELSDADTEDDDEDRSDGENDEPDDESNMSISLGLSKIYKRTLEILGDSLGTTTEVQIQADDDDVAMS